MTNKEINRWLSISSVISGMQRDAGLHARHEHYAGIFTEKLAELFEHAAVSLFMADEDGTNFLAEAGDRETGKMDYSADMPLMEHLAGSGKSILKSGPEDPAAAGLFPGHRNSSAICCPVYSGPALRGFILLLSGHEGFSGDDLRLVELAAASLSMLLQLSSVYARVTTLTVRDVLTGCLNKKKFLEDIETEIPCSERYGRPLSLLRIDIDNMKHFNNSYGRTEGDEVIRKVGEALSYSIRMCDRLYRYEGEEFILILPGIDKERAIFAANRLQKVLGQLSFEDEGRPRNRITYSIGVASFPVDALYKEALVRTMDTAIRNAREKGGDCVVSL